MTKEVISRAFEPILVNDGNLKTRAYCAKCGTKIGQCYVREIGSRSVFCDFSCYCCAEAKSASCLGDSTDANLFAASQRPSETK